MRQRSNRLGRTSSFRDFEVITLDQYGRPLDERGEPLGPGELSDYLGRVIQVPADCSDIVVFVHGWRTSNDRALDIFGRFFGCVVELSTSLPSGQALGAHFKPYFVGIRWPSSSKPGPSGYRTIRDRAHNMTLDGSASAVIAYVLGYLDAAREPPEAGPEVLTTRGGQFLHCVGHSFGGRFLAEAIRSAADNGPETLGWPWSNDRPFGVDTLLVFQMAARPDIFDTALNGLLEVGAIHGPVVLTFSRSDYANSVWHRLMERQQGIGAVGAKSARGETSTIVLKRTSEPYGYGDFSTQIVNVDSSFFFRNGRRRFEGAHSDYWRSESFHLLFSLFCLARP